MLTYMGRPKLLNPCEYCHDLFGVNELHAHRGRCHENPRTTSNWAKSYKTITCSFCGESISSKQFQPHLRKCPTAPSCGDGERICTFCQLKQPIGSFINAGTRLDYKCLECNKRLSASWYQGNKGRARDQMIRWRFGITGDTYRAMLADQGGTCAICGTLPDPSAAYNKRTLAVDHNHGTGAVRGLLCPNCNNGLGCFRDNISVMEKAIAYLRRYA